MDDRSLYATILGLTAPWDVEHVELRETEQVVHLWVRGSRPVTSPCRITAIARRVVRIAVT
ncbi:MAG: hypothetical protein JWN53_460 [Gemmatimonadetes bacterium]|jgi:hypothetical protein|nr:hypothetical protein [Gemmatimonadota bacterium]